jgi:hypothetical protein
MFGVPLLGTPAMQQKHAELRYNEILKRVHEARSSTSLAVFKFHMILCIAGAPTKGTPRMTPRPQRSGSGRAVFSGNPVFLKRCRALGGRGFRRRPHLWPPRSSFEAFRCGNRAGMVQKCSGSASGMLRRHSGHVPAWPRRANTKIQPDIEFVEFAPYRGPPVNTPPQSCHRFWTEVH